MPVDRSRDLVRVTLQLLAVAYTLLIYWVSEDDASVAQGPPPTKQRVEAVSREGSD